MYVKFDFTEDDLVDAAERFLSRSKSVRSARIRGVVYSAIGASVVVAPAAIFVGYMAAAVSAAVALYVIGYEQLSYRKKLRNRLRGLVREQHGRFGTDVCEVELTPVGVCVRQCRIQITYEWEGVEEVVETPESLDIYTRNGGGVIVRARAFESPAERRRFRELAEGYVELSRAGAAPVGAGESGAGLLNVEDGGEVGNRQ
jgi:hypothetical protein